MSPLLDPRYFWFMVSRFGEAQILLPAAFTASVWLSRRPAGRPLTAWWLGWLAAATLLTTASKVAFIGWGVGLPALDFTGVSGHAMFAAAIYPLLLGVLAASLQPRLQWLAVAAGVAVAVLIGVSRVKVQAHSESEVWAGLALGFAVTAFALTMARLPHTRVRWWIPLAVAAWMSVMPMQAPPSTTHGWVTRLSLALSGRSHPYTRQQMLRDWEATRVGSS